MIFKPFTSGAQSCGFSGRDAFQRLACKSGHNYFFQQLIYCRAKPPTRCMCHRRASLHAMHVFCEMLVFLWRAAAPIFTVDTCTSWYISRCGTCLRDASVPHASTAVSWGMLRVWRALDGKGSQRSLPTCHHGACIKNPYLFVNIPAPVGTWQLPCGRIWKYFMPQCVRFSHLNIPSNSCRQSCISNVGCAAVARRGRKSRLALGSDQSTVRPYHDHWNNDMQQRSKAPWLFSSPSQPDIGETTAPRVSTAGKASTATTRAAEGRGAPKPEVLQQAVAGALPVAAVHARRQGRHVALPRQPCRVDLVASSELACPPGAAQAADQQLLQVVGQDDSARRRGQQTGDTAVAHTLR